MRTFLHILLMIVCLCLVILVLLQGGRTDGLNSRVYGQGLSLFSSQKARGSELMFERITFCFATAFFVIIALLAICSV